MRRFALAVAAAALAAGLAACAPPGPPGPPGPPREEATRAAGPAVALPPMRTFGATRVDPPRRPNSEIAQDFLDLTFRMESGRTLPVMARFEAPVRIGLRGPVPATAPPDLDRLIARLRREAGIDIARARPGEAVNLTIEFLPRSTMQRAVPLAACFVVPRAETFSDFRRGRLLGAPNWAALARREAVTVFVPSDVAPQEVRDCLHEEVAQALGPLNDLYRLPDSVFNDDNFHAVLTGFDMLILRLTYHPELASGMSEAEVAARLPGLLARLNPAGQRGGGLTRYESRVWVDAVETALSPRVDPVTRRAAAGRALNIAEAQGWRDSRLAYSHFTLGRTSLAREFDLALRSYLAAASLYAGRGTEVQAAHVAMQLAAFALSSGQSAAAIAMADRFAPVARRAENAALLATLLLVKAEALDLSGREAEARSVRLDALGWARYSFGGDGEVRRRLAEIAALRPRLEGGGT